LKKSPPQRDRASETSYTSIERTTIRKLAERLLGEAEKRLEQGQQLKELLRHSSHPDDKALWALIADLTEHGTLPAPFPLNFGKRIHHRHRITSRTYLTSLFFPTGIAIFAAALLLTAIEGYNHSTLTNLQLSDSQPDILDDKKDIFRLESTKARRGAGRTAMSFNLVDAGPKTSGALIRRILDITSLARAILKQNGAQANHLFISLVSPTGSTGNKPLHLRTGVPNDNHGSECTKLANLRDENGKLVRVSLRRLRRTQQVLSRKPAQNTQQTHDNTYVLPDANARAISKIVTERGLNDALEHAQSTVKVRWEATRNATDVNSTTTLADCDDFQNGPFAKPGEPCDASFLMCLACENATVTRHHLPRLVLLETALIQKQSLISVDAWRKQWINHWRRLQDILQTNTTPQQRETAMLLITDADRSSIDELLDGKLDAL